MAPSQLPTTSTYINIEKLTANDFTPYSYANDLVKSVNNASNTGQQSIPSDALVDLTTPLQKTLFDLQEIDTSIHTLTSRSALDILQYTRQQNVTAQRILEHVEEERSRLVADFERLKGEVLGRYERAERARVGAERSLKVVGLSRGVRRVVGLARSFEAAMGDSGLGNVAGGREVHGELVRAANVVLEFRGAMSERDAGELGKVMLVKQVRGRIFEDGEARVLDWARRVVREFSVSSLVSASGMGSTYKEAEEARSRFTCAVHVLYLLSPAPRLEGGRKMRKEEFEAEYLLRVLQGYLQSAVTSSAGGIGKGLAQLPLLERALLEASARCQNVIAFEVLLGGITPPEHSLLQGKEKTRKKSKKLDDDGLDDIEDEFKELDVEDEDVTGEENLLEPLLSSLDTSSLASYFWRSLASSLTSKVQEIINRGGVSVRTLRSNKDVVRTEIRDCVLRGSRMPATLMGHGSTGKEEVVGNWEREAAVMVGSVLGPLNR
ncbi:Conserved oligomeric Golgi complex subunit [Exophiala xenobiotica]|uniref:Conserved oligomeric Golgi complex subunit n=1 Tax=Lithohypha guttulata TaxID=1690604 RepID=A0ABR0KL66_9EURO|nr:Conserved oligomeric Golgi complex subunit [Lithohypha guttulata]KAK5329070.1 Conserved oligomeric Golgi complex subunit [Exophiala xenobiotica]